MKTRRRRTNTHVSFEVGVVDADTQHTRRHRTTHSDDDKQTLHGAITTSTTTTTTILATINNHHNNNNYYYYSAAKMVAPTTVLPILVFLDMFCVSLVVPLLFEYFKDAGVTEASQRELLSSIYSFSQIVGGLMIGALADSNVLSRRTVLLLSFVGSAVAYALIVLDNFVALVLSRVVVGLVKQTMTVSTTLLANYTTPANRAKHMGRLSASLTVAWTIGPATGALLYKNVDRRAPPLLASGIFLVNVLLALLLLPSDGTSASDGNSKDDNNEKDDDKKSKTDKRTFLQNLQACFSSPQLAAVVMSKLLLGWVFRASSSNSMASYYQRMYGMEPHQRGYLQSYTMILSFLVQSFLVGPLLSWLNGERRAAVASLWMFTLTTVLELSGSLVLFFGIVAPSTSLSMAVLRLSLDSLLTQVAPKASLGSVLAAMDVLQNATAVTVPFYRAILFSYLVTTDDSANGGEPAPHLWVMVSFAHWLMVTIVSSVLLLRSGNSNGVDKTTMTTKKNMNDGKESKQKDE